MRFSEVLLFYFITCVLFAQIQADPSFELGTSTGSHKIATQIPQRRSLENLQCSIHGKLNGNNQCICDVGYFDEKCGTSATRLALNEFIYAPLVKGKAHFYIDITDENKDLKLTFEFLPMFVHVDLAFADLSNFLLPKNIFAFFDSDGRTLWEIPLSFKPRELSSENRLFIFVDIKGNQEPNKNFKIKVNEESSSTLTIILIVVGTISIILNIVGCIYFVKYKIRREVQAALRQQLERDNLYASSQRHIDRNRSRINLDPDAALTLEDLNLYFPEHIFQELKSTFSQMECPICLEEFKVDGVCRQLYCEHIFHTQCIQFWLAKQKACPTCKKSMSRRAIADYYAVFKKEENAGLLPSNQNEIGEPIQQPAEHPIEIPSENAELGEAIDIDKPEEVNNS